MIFIECTCTFQITGGEKSRSRGMSDGRGAEPQIGWQETLSLVNTQWIRFTDAGGCSLDPQWPPLFTSKGST